MTKKINEIASVNIGVVKSRSSDINYMFEYDLVELNNMSNKGHDGFTKFKSIKRIEQKYILKKGDILVKSSPPHDIYLVDEKLEGKIFASNFINIRSVKLDPKLLWFYLLKNRNKIQVSRNVFQILRASEIGSLIIKIDEDVQKIKKEIQLFEMINKLNDNLSKEIELNKKIMKEILGR